jgi:hypothetical protein
MAGGAVVKDYLSRSWNSSLARMKVMWRFEGG